MSTAITPTITLEVTEAGRPWTDDETARVSAVLTAEDDAPLEVVQRQLEALGYDVLELQSVGLRVMATVARADGPALVLCRVSLRDAQRLGMAARAAGGWIATDNVCRYVAATVFGERATDSDGTALVALLHSGWSEARSPLTTDEAEDIVDRLERAGARGETVAADFAARIRKHLAGGAS